ncbi:MAG: hypothetical protein KDE27_30425, partial [Planctomycetes bacterium]|nr:hypothetical protein [Planctomycetota bacterium]
MGRWFWLTLLALLILAGMVVGSLSAEQPEWQVAQRWLGDRQREWQHEGCPVLGGDALAGCSRTDYRAASDLAAKLPEALSKIVGKLIDSGYDPDPDTLAATAATVAALRRGAHRAEDIDPDAPRLGERALATMVDVFAMQVGFGALRLHARVADSPPAAVGLLTDGLAAAIDLAAAGIGIERAIGIVAADA